VDSKSGYPADMAGIFVTITDFILILRKAIGLD